MTEKEKEKAYDEAIERAKKSYGNGIAEEIFFELNEDNDKNIKNAILDLLKIWRNYKDYVCGVYVEDAIAWLEKQGKNSADKIEPRFKVGDWVVFITNKSVYQVEKKENYEYTLRNIFGSSLCLSFSKEELIRKWTIQDAKDGDVLEFGDHGRRVIGILSYINKTTGKVDVSCLLECNKFKVGVFYNLDTVKPHPVTKEQRDALMKAMNDAGYKWNTETKTLEKLVEPKFKVGDKIVNLPMKYMGGSWTQGTISKITDDKYIFTDGSYISISSQNSWKLVYDKKSKFDPKTLQSFDKVLVRDDENLTWKTNMFSYIDNNKKYPYICLLSCYRYCIPYNDDTKYLVGTTDEAPEYYRYWED